MRYLKLRLIIAVAAFAIWTAWLANQAYWTADPIVVSRPQVLAAPIIVEAAIDGTAADQLTTGVVHKGQKELGLEDGQKQFAQPLFIGNLNATRGFAKAGTYLLALEPAMKNGRAVERDGKPVYDVVRIPHSPGFPPPAETDEQRKKRDELLKPPIYPANESTRMQLESILQSMK